MQDLSTPDASCTMTQNKDKKSQAEEKSAPRVQNTMLPATNDSHINASFQLNKGIFQLGQFWP